MKNIKLAIYFITTGVSLGFTLVIYAHSNFATKDMLDRYKISRDREVDKTDARLDRIESKIDRLIEISK